MLEFIGIPNLIKSQIHTAKIAKNAKICVRRRDKKLNANMVVK